MSVDPLCTEAAPCSDGTGAGISGLQGSPVGLAADILPVPALGEFPGTGTVTEHAGPLASYMVKTTEIVGLAGTSGDVEPPADIPPDVPDVARLPDLAVVKTGRGHCRPGEECSYSIVIPNHGPVDYTGPIVLTDRLHRPTLNSSTPCPRPGSARRWTATFTAVTRRRHLHPAWA